MILQELHHCAIRTTKLEETREFYADILELEVGNRPDFDFPGYWLYLDGRAIVHLIGVDPDNPQGLIDYLGDGELDANAGTGAFDHLAFMISEPTQLRRRLKKMKFPFRDREVPDMDLQQIFLEDPNGVTIELNYISSDGPTIFDMPAKKAGRKTTVSREELLGRARELAPALRERSAAAEELGRMPEETMDDLRVTGLMGILQPARVGGGEFDFGAIIEATIEIGRACGSTGWVYANLASHHWMLAMFPEKAQDDVWGENTETLTATSLIYPAGRAKKVKGGYELSGRWPFCSGLLHSDWIILGGMVQGESENSPPEPRLFLLPKCDLELIDTWDVTGLRATGSIDSVVNEVFVPDHRTLAAADVRGDATPGSAVNPAPLYRLPVAALFPHLIAAPVLAMAFGVNDSCTGAMRARISTFNKSKVSDHATTQLRVSDALAAADGARMMLLDNAREAHRFADAAAMPDMEAKMRWRRDAAFATTMAADAAGRLYRSNGGSVIYNKNPLQRQFRDLHAGLVHIGVSNDVNGVGYGRVALGLDPENPVV